MSSGAAACITRIEIRGDNGQNVSMNRVKTVLICIFASFIISGLLNPIGLISGPVAESFGIPITVAVARFGYFTVGVFAGYILSFHIFDHVKLKTVVVVGYVLIAASVGGLYTFPTAPALAFFLFMIGLLASVQVCGASTLVSWIWSGKPRQTMLIAQDAMFNGGGIVFTTITTWFLAANYHWASTYAVVAALALLIAGIAATSEVQEQKDRDEESRIRTSWNLGILTVGGSILLFMIAKISVFIWAPQYVEQAFGATIQQSGRLLTNIFIGAFCGSLIGTYVVSRVRVARAYRVFPDRDAVTRRYRSISDHCRLRTTNYSPCRISGRRVYRRNIQRLYGFRTELRTYADPQECGLSAFGGRNRLRDRTMVQ
jgi:predicted MFS family arabinose efflux permease